MFTCKAIGDSRELLDDSFFFFFFFSKLKKFKNYIKNAKVFDSHSKMRK